MSRAYEAAKAAKKAYPNDRLLAVDLFLGYLDVSESDFEYEFSQTPEEYLFGKEKAE